MALTAQLKDRKCRGNSMFGNSPRGPPPGHLSSPLPSPESVSTLNIGSVILLHMLLLQMSFPFSFSLLSLFSPLPRDPCPQNGMLSPPVTFPTQIISYRHSITHIHIGIIHMEVSISAYM